MQSELIISIMRSRGWLKEEPSSTREKVTSATRYMLVKHRMNMVELAPMLADRSPTYIHKKVSEGRWMMEDLDRLPVIFGRTSADYVQGYLRMAELDDADATNGEGEGGTHE